MANLPRQQCDKIVVGTFDTSQEIDTKDQSPTGTLVANGPVVLGNVKQFGNDYSGVLNVSSDSCEQIPFDQQPKLDVKLAGKFDGNVKIEGDKKTEFALEVSGGSNQVLKVHGDAIFTAISPQLLSSRFKDKADQLPAKPFDIKHPIKDGYRLRHISLEGPESGVYYRGRLKGSNIIELPSYWRGLVHEDSITVQLQPIGKNQSLVIESFSNEFITIEIGANQDFLTGEILIDCFYHVYGERKDVNPLLVEYEGDEYPDPNFSNKCDVPIEDRNFVDPKYRFPRNVTTND